MQLEYETFTLLFQMMTDLFYVGLLCSIKIQMSINFKSKMNTKDNTTIQMHCKTVVAINVTKSEL